MSLTRPVKLIPDGPMPAARSLSVTFASDAQGLPVSMSGSGIRPMSQSVSMTLASDHPPISVSLPPNGQQTMANSRSVALASDQSALGILEPGTGIINGSVTALSQRIAATLTRFNGASIYIAGAYAGITLAFEASYDGGATYIPAQAVAINGLAPIANTGALTNTSTVYRVYCPGATQISVRSTSFTSGNMSVRIAPYAIAADPNPVITGALTANQSVNASLWAGSAALNGGTAGSVGVGGLAADSATVSGNPILTAGRVRAAVDSTFAANDAMALTGTTGMQLLVKPYGLPETDWQFTAALSNNVATAARAPGPAGIRNYTTALQYQNTSAVASEIQVLDGATILWRGQAPANMALPASIQWPTPLRGAAATALNVQLITTAANTLVNLQGYQAP